MQGGQKRQPAGEQQLARPLRCGVSLNVVGRRRVVDAVAAGACLGRGRSAP